MSQTITIAHDGIERSLYQRPVECPRLAILLLHPAASSGRAMALTGGWSRDKSLSLLAPDGLSLDCAAERCDTNPSCWSSEDGPTAGRQVDDVGFIDKALDLFMASVPAGVPLVVVGHSNGCGMAFRLLAESRYRDRFEVAVLLGAAWAASKAPISLPILYLNGDDDPIRPFLGAKLVRTPWFSYSAEPVMATVRTCLQQLGVEAETPTTLPNADYSATRWVSGRALFELRVLHGHGHHWPTGSKISEESAAVVGPSNPALNATSMALEFIAQNLRSRVPGSGLVRAAA